jgi:hypothetical protein
MGLQDEIVDIVNLEDILDTSITSLSPDTPTRSTLSQADLLKIVESACPLYWESINRYLTRPTAKTVNDEDLQAAFRRFIIAESSLSGMSAEHLVRPSGSIQARLGIKLHYPTFTTTKNSYGESADWSNPCTRLLLKKGLSPDNLSSFWFESYFRRQNAPQRRQNSPMKGWTAAHRKIHESFSKYCEASMSCRVLLVFGRENRLQYSRNEPLDSNALRVVTEIPIKCEDVTVNLGLVSNDSEVSMLLVYCHHPEWLYRDGTILGARQYDAAINIAAALSGIHHQMAPRFFEKRMELRVDSGWSGPVTPFHLAMQLVQSEKRGEPTCLSKDLPEPILQWLSLRNLGLKELDERTALRDTSPASTVLSIMAHLSADVQHDIDKPFLQTRQRTELSRTTSLNIFLRTSELRLDVVVEVHCGRCSSSASRWVDTRPTFVTIEPLKGSYIAQSSARCPTPDCCSWLPKTGKQRQMRRRVNMIPVNKSIPYTTGKQIDKLKTKLTSKRLAQEMEGGTSSILKAFAEETSGSKGVVDI